MAKVDELEGTITDLVKEGKGILAADESTPTITKRFNAVGIESTEESRRKYRQLLLTAPDVGRYLSGIILYDETLAQKSDDGVPLPQVARDCGVVPGIKVDKGLTEQPGTNGEKITQGLDGLGERLEPYKEQGARFAKWRDVYAIGAATPSRLAIETNAEVLARYAAICQRHGVVPIVEPEVLIDGNHTMTRCAEVTEQALHAVFHALHRHGVLLEYMLLKPNMVVPGKEYHPKSSPEEVAEQTIRVLQRTVPAAVPSINFLSGGQSPEEATANLNAMNAGYSVPWQLSFSYARALQEPPMAIWKGDEGNVSAAQAAFARRLRLNGAARRGEYRAEMEGEEA